MSVNTETAYLDLKRSDRDKWGYECISQLGSLFDVEEKEFLKSIIKNKNKGLVLEVGCLFGVTTQIIASQLGRNDAIVCIDNFSWNPFGFTSLETENFTRKNLYYLIEKGIVSLYSIDKNDFYSKNKESLNGRVTTCFLDAIHEYEETKLDIQFAKEIGCKNILLHDYSKHYPGVMQAVDEMGGVKEKHGSIVLMN